MVSLYALGTKKLIFYLGTLWIGVSINKSYHIIFYLG